MLGANKKATTLIRGNQTGYCHNRGHQQGSNFDCFTRNDTTRKRPTWLTAAQRIQLQKGKHCCIAALLPTGKQVVRARRRTAKTTRKLGGKHKGYNYNRSRQQGSNFDYYSRKDTTTKRPTWLTTAQRIQPRKG